MDTQFAQTAVKSTLTAVAVTPIVNPQNWGFSHNRMYVNNLIWTCVLHNMSAHSVLHFFYITIITLIIWSTFALGVLLSYVIISSSLMSETVIPYSYGIKKNLILLSVPELFLIYRFIYQMNLVIISALCLLVEEFQSNA